MLIPPPIRLDERLSYRLTLPESLRQPWDLLPVVDSAQCKKSILPIDSHFF